MLPSRDLGKSRDEKNMKKGRSHGLKRKPNSKELSRHLGIWVRHRRTRGKKEEGGGGKGGGGKEEEDGDAKGRRERWRGRRK